MKKLNDYLTDDSPLFFSCFRSPVWAYDFPDTDELDTYFITRYGNRTAFTTVLNKYADTDGHILSGMQALSNMIYNINKRKWQHLFKVYKAEYSPIENTDVYEEVTEDNQLNRSIDSVKTNSNTVNSDTSTTATGTGSGASNRYGFNSSSAVGDTTESQNTSANSSTDVETTETGRDTDTTGIEDNEDKLLKRHKHGNIGVTENTTMLAHEVDFWKWSFIDAVCKDICDIIALSIY